MNLKFNSLIIFVRDVDQLKSFYTGIFNLQVIEEIKSEWLLLNAGSCNIALHKIGQQYLENAGEFPGQGSNTKMVFDVEEDIYQLRDRLLSIGVALQEIKTFDNFDYFICDGEDPEGNIFQLRQPKQLLNKIAGSPL